ncbi:hypothetical protein B0H19DRAFT_1259675 [Mycena capillaripes]|nr:hypothetical protein B0H19DRAFT_1259675 [Mycena capillaripes]
MFSFSKVLAFGLAALSSVRATPFMQIPIVSCSVDFGTPAAPTNTLAGLDPGVYTIVNAATNIPVFASVENGGVFMTEGKWPEPFGLWKLEKAENRGGFTISNVALGSPIFVGSDRMVYCGKSKSAEVFAVSPAGPEVFDIKEVSQDEVWTVEHGARWSLVNVSPSKGDKEQLWHLIPASK